MIAKLLGQVGARAPGVVVAVGASVGVVCVGSRDHPSKCAGEPSSRRVIREIVALDILDRRSRVVAQGVPSHGADDHRHGRGRVYNLTVTSLYVGNSPT